MAEKVKTNALTDIDEETIQPREEVNLQYQSLKEVVRLGDLYGLDVRRPATNVKEAIQCKHCFHGCPSCCQRCRYFTGCVPIFDIYAERDLARGTFTESEIQESC